MASIGQDLLPTPSSSPSSSAPSVVVPITSMRDAVDSASATASSSSRTEVTIPAGKVGQVCREWLVREDGGFAYRLQSEEISKFYEGNRNKNQVVRVDAPLARSLQQEEVIKAHILREKEKQRQMHDDSLIASLLQEEQDRLAQIQRRERELIDAAIPESVQSTQQQQLELANGEDRTEVKKVMMTTAPPRPSSQHPARSARKSSSSQSSSSSPTEGMVERDRQLAERIHAKEKMRALRRKLAKERRQVARLMSNCHGNNHHMSSSSDDLLDTDLSDFCMKSPPGLTEEESRIFQEEQDAELARFLQQQETARNAVKDKLIQMEAQDAEIARIIHEQEKAKLKKIKDRKRDKQRLQRQMSGDRDHLHRSSFNTSNGVNNNSNGHDQHHHYQSLEEVDEELRLRRQREKQLSGMGSYDVLESMSYVPRHRLNKSADSVRCPTPPLITSPVSSSSSSSPQRHQHHQSSTSSPTTSATFHNIAMDLDPTYKRRMSTSSTNQGDSSNTNNNSPMNPQSTSNFHDHQLAQQQVAINSSGLLVSSLSSNDPSSVLYFARLSVADAAAVKQVDSTQQHQINPIYNMAPTSVSGVTSAPKTLSDLESVAVLPGHHRKNMMDTVGAVGSASSSSTPGKRKDGKKSTSHKKMVKKDQTGGCKTQ